MKRTRTCVIALAAGGLSGDGEQGVYTHTDWRIICNMTLLYSQFSLTEILEIFRPAAAHRQINLYCLQMLENFSTSTY